MKLVVGRPVYLSGTAPAQRDPDSKRFGYAEDGLPRQWQPQYWPP